MKKLLALIVLLTSAVSAMASADLIYVPDWAGGSGDLSSASRYINRKTKENQTPAKGDTVLIQPSYFKNPQPTEFVVDIDNIDFVTNTFENVNAYSEGATVVYDFGATDIYNYPVGIYCGGMATVVKNGSGKLWMKSTANFSCGGTVIVSNGWLKVGRVSGSLPLIDVEADAIYEFSATGHNYARGLTGSGTFTNSVSSASAKNAMLYIQGSGTTNVFSGKILGYQQVCLGTMDFNPSKTQPSYQYFTGECATTVSMERMYTGVYGANRFWDGVNPAPLGSTSSFGMQGTYAPGADVTIRYTGNQAATFSQGLTYMNGTCPTNRTFRLDGGDYGALTYSGTLLNNDSFGSAYGVYWTDHVNTFYLQGDGKEVNVFSGGIREKSDANHLCIHKAGSGTWRIANHSYRQQKTPLFVERGKLQYDTIAEAGTACSLGYNTCYSTNSIVADGPLCDYAIMVGDGTAASEADVATFEYTGSTAVDVKTRAIGINGAGCIVNGSDKSFKWKGVSAMNEATLILDGTGNDVLTSVTNGVGTLSVEKRGSGKWTLSNNVNLSGDLVVNGGTLDLVAARTYSWYKFVMKENWGDVSGTRFMFYDMTFWDEDGVPISIGVTYNQSADGNLSALQAGQCCMDKTDFTWFKSASESTPRYETYAFDGKNSTVADITFTKAPSLADPTTWRSFVIRMPAGSKPATKFDYWAPAGTKVDGVAVSAYPRDPRSWSVYGSGNGEDWEELVSVTSNTLYYTAASWNSVRDTTFNPSNHIPSAAHVIATKESKGVEMSSVRSISVGTGATLKTDAELSTAKIVYDTTKGAGTIEGITFADNGTLEIVNAADPNADIDINYTMTDCTDASNIATWQVKVNGSVKTRQVSVVNGKISVRKLGLIIFYQ